jgi:hypothetical protein
MYALNIERDLSVFYEHMLWINPDEVPAEVLPSRCRDALVSAEL